MSEEMKKSLRLNLEAGLRIYNRTVPIFPEQARFILNLLESRPTVEEDWDWLSRREKMNSAKVAEQEALLKEVYPFLEQEECSCEDDHCEKRRQLLTRLREFLKIPEEREQW